MNFITLQKSMHVKKRTVKFLNEILVGTISMDLGGPERGENLITWA